jgi:predicted AAA+ superfamily ATPase
MEEAVIMEYIKSIYSTIVLKDVVQRKNIRNTAFLEQLIMFLANNTGNLFSSKSISDFLKGQKIDLSPYVVSEYAMALADSFMVHRVGRYDIAGKKLFERGEKYYFENLGIRNVIAGYKLQDRARRLENLVYNHLTYCGYDVKIGAFGTEEIDFVCRRNGEILYVQVAVEIAQAETMEREFGNLLRIKDNYPKVVVTAEKSLENTYEGVEHIYIRNFLTSK